MLQKSSEIVLDTSRNLRIISHTERQPTLKTYLEYGTRSNLFPTARLYLTRKIVLPGSRIDLNDDSQFFVTTGIYPNLPESFAPPIRNLIGGAPLF